MSNSNLTKKLLPLRKALKNIKNNLRLKLSYSSKIISVIQIARKRCVLISRSISRLIYTKFRTLTNSPRLNSNHSYENFSVVYIDELFQGKTLLAEQIKPKETMVPSSSTTYVKNRSSQMTETSHDVPDLQNRHVNVESSTNHGKGLPVGKGKAISDYISKNPAAADKWKIPLLPKFRGIDERAEEFISKFRQDMKLQREQSILEFEEMLKRSV